MLKNGGQVEIEAILGIIAVLFVFVAIISITSARNSEIETLASISQAQSQCNQLSSVISFMNNGKYNSEITIAIENDMNLFTDHINADGIICDFFGDASQAQLYRGTIRVYKSGGVVHAENA